VVQAVEHLLCECEALNSNPSPTKKKYDKEKTAVIYSSNGLTSLFPVPAPLSCDFRVPPIKEVVVLLASHPSMYIFARTGCYNKIPQRGGFKRQTFISHYSGGSLSGWSLVSASSCVADGLLLSVSAHGGATAHIGLFLFS
jgi:hypothetical protein